MHGSETWPVRKENEVAEMRMVRWMCVLKLQDRVPSRVERENRISSHNLSTTAKLVVMYGHVLQKEENYWVKKCMEYEVEGVRPRGRPKKTWREIVEKDCKARGLNREDAMDRSKWRKQIGIFDDHDGCEWVNVSSGTGSPGLFRTKSIEP